MALASLPACSEMIFPHEEEDFSINVILPRGKEFRQYAYCSLEVSSGAWHEGRAEHSFKVNTVHFCSEDSIVFETKKKNLASRSGTS